MPKLSGNTAPATPCSTRNPIRTSRLGASAQPTVAIARTISTAVSTRTLPSESPSRPKIGMLIDDDRKKPDTIQAAAVGDASNSRSNSGNAGSTSVCMNE